MKPIAWMDEEGGFYGIEDYEICKSHNLKVDLIPLYTSPRELSDEEIEQTAEMMADMYNSAMLKLSCSRGYSEQCDVMSEILKAILKKASEK